ncbi:MAG: Spy/CpxP family protein refolding chaperone [Minwuia sp.]|uniref:Spy/CpxP family protein refolding chaperone n=1 Tax=Minwuia sp. TaxID=2493630 RepID=UPI003A84CB39
MIRRLLAGAAIVLAAAGAHAQQHGHGQPYAGQHARDISSLSAADIAALEAGHGWGLAKPAELNGYPGPAHLLELHEELELDDGQMAAIQSIHDRMRQKARELGAELLAAEADVDRLFRERKADAGSLRAALNRAAQAKLALRETHLAAHLEVTPLLTEHQRQTYGMLRGYGGSAHGRHGSQ